MKDLAMGVGITSGILGILGWLWKASRSMVKLEARIDALESADERLAESILEIKDQLAANADLQREQIHALGRIEGRLENL